MGRHIPIAFKNDVLDLLPFLLTLPEKMLDPIKSKLNDLVVFDFPMRSRDLPTDSTVCVALFIVKFNPTLLT
jgi:hypothetical protein